jgi:hypothetical protein
VTALGNRKSAAKRENTVFYRCFMVWHAMSITNPSFTPPPFQRNRNMKRFLMIAFAGAALTFLIPSADATAADFHHGGGHGYSGGHGYVGHGGGHVNYGHGYTGGHGYYGGHGVTRQRIVTPYYGSAYGGHYAPSFRSYRPAYRGHGGVHLDVGRLHLGVGGHH